MNAKCPNRKCGRPLKPGEKQCPHCTSQKDFAWKKGIEAAGILVFTSLAIMRHMRR